jgi:short-subunit dehydrogenase
MNDIQPRVIVVTGASAGVGRATVRAFAKEGAHLGLIARGEDGLEGAKRDVEERGGKALMLPLDVAEFGSVEAATERVEHELGPIDVWVNVAMTSVFSPVKEMKPEEYKRVMEVNYLGYVYGTLAALKRMLPRDRGRILQVGSALAYRGIPLQSAYCASKHAIQGFMDSLRCELIHDRSNVKICMLQLPAMNTPQFGWVRNRLPNKAQPVPPIFQPEIAADAIVFASHKDRREIYVGLPTVEAIVGNKLFPGLLDHYLAKTGYKAQQTNEPKDPSQPDNLFLPVPGDHGPHGTFGSRASNWSPQLWTDKHRATIGLGLLTLIGAGLAGLLVRKS